MLKPHNILLAACILAVGALLTPTRAADTTTQPATQPTPPACCGDACKKMGTCCTADDKGNVTCPMGGNCCTKSTEKKNDNKSDGTNKGMGGMDMGK